MNAQQIGSDIHTFQDAVAKGEYGKASIALADMTANGGHKKHFTENRRKNR